MAAAGTERAPLLAPGQSSNHARPVAERQQTLKSVLKRLPPSVADLALGVCGLGITWQTAADYLLAGQSIKTLADVFSLISFNLGSTLLLLYILKAALVFPSVLEDALSVDGNAVLPCLDMALMMIAWWLDIHGFHSVGHFLWGIAVIIHVALLILFCRHILKRQWELVAPSWLLPTVGIAMAAGTGAAIGMGNWCHMFWWIGFFAFLVLYPAVLYRVHAHPEPMSEEHESLYPYVAAPAAILLSSWIAMGGHQGHSLTHFLFLVQMTSVVLVALKIPHLTMLPFNVQSSSLSFPADITAKSCVLYSHLYLASSTVMVMCSWFFVLTASVAVCYTAARFGSAAFEAISNKGMSTGGKLEDPAAEL